MSNYHFEDDDKEFGETIDVSHIQKKVRLPEDQAEDRRREEKRLRSGMPQETQRRREPVRRREEAFRQMDRRDREAYDGIVTHNRPASTGSSGKKNGGSSFRLLVMVAVILGIAAFLIVFLTSFGFGERLFGNSSFGSGQQTENGETGDSSGGGTTVSGNESRAVLRSVNGQALEVYNITKATVSRLTVPSSAQVTDGSGNAKALSDFAPGDFLLVAQDATTGDITKISATQAGFTLSGVTGQHFENTGGSLNVQNQDLTYLSDTVAVKGGKTVSLSEMDSADTCILRGFDGVIYSVSVDLTHGTLRFLHTDTVRNVVLKLDDNTEEIALNDNVEVPVSAGVHTLHLTGGSIQDYTLDNLYVGENETVEVDLSTLQGKSSLLVLNVEPDGYTLYVDGAQQDASENPLVLSPGSHTVRITKDGYKDYETTVEITEDPYTLNATLESAETGSVTFRSVPAGARVYVDEEYRGVAPVMVTLPFGSHTVRYEMDGYRTVNVPVAVNLKDQVITGELKEE